MEEKISLQSTYIQVRHQLNIVQEAAVEVAEAENAHTVMELVKNW